MLFVVSSSKQTKKENKRNKTFLPVSCEKHRKKRLYVVQVVAFADVAVGQNLLNHQKQNIVKKNTKQKNNNKNRATLPSNVIPLFFKTKVY